MKLWKHHKDGVVLLTQEEHEHAVKNDSFVLSIEDKKVEEQKKEQTKEINTVITEIHIDEERLNSLENRCRSTLSWNRDWMRMKDTQVLFVFALSVLNLLLWLLR